MTVSNMRHDNTARADAETGATGEASQGKTRGAGALGVGALGELGSENPQNLNTPQNPQNTNTPNTLMGNKGLGFTGYQKSEDAGKSGKSGKSGNAGNAGNAINSERPESYEKSGEYEASLGNKDSEQDGNQLDYKDNNQEDSLGDRAMSSYDYEDFNIPDHVELNEGIMREFKEFSASKALSQKEAQSLIDMQLRVNAEQAEGWFRQTESWAREIEADKVYGGKNFGRTVASANKVLGNFDKSGKVTEFLQSSGYGNNPDIIRFLADIHKKHMADDAIVHGSRAWNEQRLVDRLWPDK